MFKTIAIENKNMANGQRNLSTGPLTNEEIEFVKKEIVRIGAGDDMDLFVFNDPDHIHNAKLGTGYNYVKDKIFITKNVFPETQYGSTHPRDLMSVAAVLAHEYYGHRRYRDEYISDMKKSIADYQYHTTEVWKDECRASIDASKLAKNLTQQERSYLILDAIYRAKEYGQYIVMDDYMKGVLYGYNEEGEKGIVPRLTPIRFVSKQDVERIERDREGDDSLSELQEDSEDYLVR